MVPNIVVLGRAWAEVDGWRIMPPMDLGTSLGRSSNAALERVSALDWRFLRRFTDRLVPIGFGLMSLAVIWKFVVTPEWIGIDASLYTAASAAWLNGTDPWSVALVGVYYAAPPPTLLAFVPFVWMPPLVVSLVWVIGSFILAVLAIRSLRLPLWWVAFPPIVDGALTGNPDVAVLALLVVAGGRLGAVAPFLKIYALVPMLGERRWRQVGLAAALLLATAFVLPWAAWFAELPTITQNLTNTSRTTSVYGRPVLMAIAVVALLSLGTRRAGWLAVPLLWPTTQLHYAAISVPGLTPYLALLWCIPVPEVWLVATCVFAVYEYRVTRRLVAAGSTCSMHREDATATWHPSRADDMSRGPVVAAWHRPEDSRVQRS